MLRWSDVRPLIVSVVGTRLLPLGFKNPGRAMWRYREHFVDVVAFRCERYGKGFAFEFGSAFRTRALQRPEPPTCDFRACGLELSRTDRNTPYIGFERDLESQRRSLEALAPSIVDEARRWFALLESFDSAFEAVQTDPGRVLCQAQRGSPGQVAMMERLREAIGELDGW